MNSLQRRNQLVRYFSNHKLLPLLNESSLIRVEKNEVLKQLPLKKSPLSRKKSKIKRCHYSEMYYTAYSLPLSTFCSNMGNFLERNGRVLFTPLYRSLHISCTKSSKGAIAVFNKNTVFDQEKDARKACLLNSDPATRSLSRLHRKFSQQDVHLADRQENSSRVVDLLNRAKEMNIQAKSVRRSIEKKPLKQFRTVGKPIGTEDHDANVVSAEKAAEPAPIVQSSYREVLYDIFSSVLNRRARSKSATILSNSSITNSDTASKEKSALHKHLTKFDLLKVNTKNFASTLPVNRGKFISKLHSSSTPGRIADKNIPAISKGNIFPRNAKINQLTEIDNTDELNDQKYSKNYLKYSRKKNELVRSKTDEYLKNKYNFQHVRDSAIRSEFFPATNSNDSLRNSSIPINYGNYFKRNNRRRQTANNMRSLSPGVITLNDETSKTCYSPSSSHQDAFKRFYKKLHPNDPVNPDNSNRTISGTVPNEIIHKVVSYTKSQSIQSKNQRPSVEIQAKQQPHKFPKSKVTLASATKYSQSRKSKSSTQILQEKHKLSGRNNEEMKQILNGRFSQPRSDIQKNRTSVNETIMKDIKSNVSKALEGSAFCKMTNRLLSNIQSRSSWSSGWWENSNLGSRFSTANEARIPPSSLSHL